MDGHALPAMTAVYVAWFIPHLGSYNFSKKKKMILD